MNPASADFVMYHNPRCSKSRQTLALLKEKEIDPIVIEYLKTPPSKKTLKSILEKLDLKPIELVRKQESVWKSLKLDPTDDDAVLEAMVENPILMERPIVVRGKQAAIGRPPENVLALLTG